MSCAARASVHAPREMRRPGGRLLRWGPGRVPKQPCAGKLSFRAAIARQAHCACLDSECRLRREAIETTGRRPRNRAADGPRQIAAWTQRSFPASPPPVHCANGPHLRQTATHRGQTAPPRRPRALLPRSPSRLLECTGSCRRCEPRALRNMLARPPRARSGDGAMPDIEGARRALPPRAATAERTSLHESGAAGGLARCVEGDRVVRL